MVGEFVLEEVDLALEIARVLLFLGGDPGVEDDEAMATLCLLGGKRDSEVGLEVFLVVSVA
jgi:hypothetical protein